MQHHIHVRLRGDHACWTPLGYRSEPSTATMPSHGALRGVLKGVLSKSAFEYVFHRASVLSEPRRIPYTSNEFKFNAVGLAPVLSINGQHTQRTTVYIRNPDYLVELSLKLTGTSDRSQDTLEKYYAMLLRRLGKGQYERPPVLGTTECPARVDLVEPHELHLLPKPFPWSEDLGITLYGADWDEDLYYFCPMAIRAGVLDYPSWDEVKSFGITKKIGRAA
jgi:CRISPR-associated protein Cas5d